MAERSRIETSGSCLVPEHRVECASRGDAKEKPKQIHRGRERHIHKASLEARWPLHLSISPECTRSLALHKVRERRWLPISEPLFFHKGNKTTQVETSLVEFSRHKFASNVVEKCLEHGSADERRRLIDRIVASSHTQFGVSLVSRGPRAKISLSSSHTRSSSADGVDSTLRLLIVDPFANYVVQKVVDLADDHQVAAIVAGQLAPRFFLLVFFSFSSSRP